MGVMLGKTRGTHVVVVLLVSLVIFLQFREKDVLMQLSNSDWIENAHCGGNQLESNATADRSFSSGQGHETSDNATSTENPPLPASETDGLKVPEMDLSRDFCSAKPFTAAGVWNEYFERIWNASRIPNAEPGITNTTILRHIFDNVLSTNRLRRGIKTQPTGFSLQALRNVMDTVQKRLQDPDNAPPLQIAVFGGSVTVGRECRLSIRRDIDRECAWPNRLEKIINQFAGKTVVKVHNLGSGGTSSEQGRLLIKYWMYNSELKEVGPDVIIHSYSTNDSLLIGNHSSTEKPKLLMTQIRSTLDRYAREAVTNRPCKQPLLIFVDDYLGSQNEDSVLAELSYNNAMTQVAHWYGAMAVSYADVVRDIVYNNTHEALFSAKWHGSKGKFNVNGHFAYTGHATLAWTIAYAFLDTVSNYCEDGFSSGDNVGLPPPFQSDLTLPEISKQWRESSNKQAKCAPSKSGGDSPCEWAWLAAPNQIFQSKQLSKKVNEYLVSNTGWGSQDKMDEGWRHKVGWEVDPSVAEKATFELDLQDVSRDIRVITIIYLKSHGTKWVNSTADFTFATKTGNITRTLLGFHDSKTSISYTETIVLNDPVRIGESLRVKVNMISGTNFKIFGMMFCSR